MAHTTQHRPKPQTLTPDKHPDEYERDLNPNAMAGQNLGHAGPHPEQHARTLLDDKALHARFRDWSDDDLQQVPILPAGSRLEQGATYIDLTEEPPREFTATGDMQASQHHRLVPKSAVPYELWNRLLEIENVTRTGVEPGPTT
jgi:hypothetical protein